MVILFNGRSGGIFDDSQSGGNQLYLILINFNRLGSGIDHIMPSRFKDGRHWRKRMRFHKCKRGSISTEISMEAGGYDDGSTASTEATNALSTGDIDGVTYLSSSVTANGFATSDSSESTLGLILGLSIPLVILRTFYVI